MLRETQMGTEMTKSEIREQLARDMEYYDVPITVCRRQNPPKKRKYKPKAVDLGEYATLLS